MFCEHWFCIYIYIYIYSLSLLGGGRIAVELLWLLFVIDSSCVCVYYILSLFIPAAPQRWLCWWSYHRRTQRHFHFGGFLSISRTQKQASTVLVLELYVIRLSSYYYYYYRTTTTTTIVGLWFIHSCVPMHTVWNNILGNWWFTMFRLGF